MVKVTFIESVGTRKQVDVSAGTTLMEAAVQIDVEGIPAECGGACSCATCHVHIDSAWLDKLQAASEMEVSILDMAEAFDAQRSRLSCQIELNPDLDGLVATVPELS